MDESNVPPYPLDQVSKRLRLCVVGPLPPPSGGMANQCVQLVHLLQSEGLAVELVQSNAPLRPAWLERIPVLRAMVRTLPYAVRLWRACGRADVVHVLANSGWAWHLFAAPAIAIAKLRGVATIVNYHGGNADSFFAHAPRYVLKMLASVSLRVMPSVFLLRVSAKYGLQAEVIPNIVDLSRFTPSTPGKGELSPHLVVTRNLEAIYGIDMAIRAFARIRQSFATAQLTIAGSGPDQARLQALVCEIGLDSSVRFSGRIDNADIPRLYASATCLINPSTVDNMPISILEAFACGVPVVSTCAGGIPDMLKDGVSGLLVPVGDDAAMAEKVLCILQSPALAEQLRQAGLEEAQKYSWPQVRAQWLNAYRRAAAMEG